MNNQLQVLLEDQNITGDNALQFMSNFGKPFEQAFDILKDYQRDDKGNIIVTDGTIIVTDAIQKDVMATAREKRMVLSRIRIDVEKKRKLLKEDSLKTGQVIDKVAKYIKDKIEPTENYLELQEKFIELQEAKRIADLRQVRFDKLAPYTENPSVYSLASLKDDEFDVLFNTLKDAHDLKLKAEIAEKLRIEKEIEDKKIEDARIREENEKLKKDAEIAEEARQKERQIEADRQAKIEVEHQAELAAERAKTAAVEAEQPIVEKYTVRMVDATPESDKLSDQVVTIGNVKYYIFAIADLPNGDKQAVLKLLV